MENIKYDDLPDSVKKALIAEQYKELEGHVADITKVDDKIKEKKNEIEFWKVKTEAKQMENKLWKENNERLQAAIDKTKYEIALLDAGIHPDLKDLDRQVEMQEAHCLKLKSLWENYEVQWKISSLEAIEYHKVLERNKQKKFKINFLESQIRYLKQINRIQEEVDDRRLQLAIIDLAKEFIARRDLQNDLQTLLDTKEELKTNLALLRLDKEAKSPMSTDSSNFLMPPPSTHYSHKDMTDTISVNTVAWEDILFVDKEVEHQRTADQVSTSRQSNARSSSRISNSSCKAEKNAVTMKEPQEPPIDDPMTENTREKEPALSRYQSYELAQSKSFKNKSNLSNHQENDDPYDEVECSSTVNDYLDEHSQPLKSQPKESTNGTQPQNDMDYEISVTSSYMGSNCACSTSSMVDDEAKQAVQPESRLGSMKFADNISHEFSITSMSDVGTKENNSENNLTKSAPVIKSIETVTQNFNFFQDDFNAGPAANMFSSQFTMGLDQRKTADETDGASLSDSMKNMRCRALSPFSEMDIDDNTDVSLTSGPTFCKQFGNISPPSSKMNFLMQSQKNKQGGSTGTQKTEEATKSLYSTIQNFTDQSGSTNFFGSDNSKSLF